MESVWDQETVVGSWSSSPASDVPYPELTLLTYSQIKSLRVQCLLERSNKAQRIKKCLKAGQSKTSNP